MDVDLTPRLPAKSFGSDGGSYYSWSSSELPMLGEANIGAAKLALERRGLALPSYSDSAKIAYVLQGLSYFSLFFFFNMVMAVYWWKFMGIFLHGCVLGDILLLLWIGSIVLFFPSVYICQDLFFLLLFSMVVVVAYSHVLFCYGSGHVVFVFDVLHVGNSFWFLLWRSQVTFDQSKM